MKRKAKRSKPAARKFPARKAAPKKVQSIPAGYGA